MKCLSSPRSAILRIAFLLFILPVVNGKSVTYTWSGLTDTLWNTSTNWVGGLAPGDLTTDDIIIPTNCPFYPSLDSTISRTIGDLTIDSGATLSMAFVPGISFMIHGNFTNNGTLYQSGTSSIFLKGSAKTINGTGNFFGGPTAALYIDEGASYTLTTDVSVRYFFISATGSLDMNGYDIVTEFFFQIGNFYLRDGTLSIGGSWNASMWFNSYEYYGGLDGDTYNAYFTDSTFDAGTGTVYYNSGDTFTPAIQFVRSVNYYNLKVRTNNGFTTILGLSSPFTVDNTLEILNPGAAGGIVNTAYDITLNGDFYLGASGNALTFNLDHRIARSSPGTGTFTMGNLNTHQLNVTYADTSNWGISLGAAGASTPLTFYGTVTYTSDSTQSVMGNTYHHLTIDGTGIRNLTDHTTINGDLIIHTGSLDPTPFNYDMTIGGNLYNLSTLVLRSNTVTFGGTAAQNLTNSSGSAFTNTITASGAVGIPDNLPVGGVATADSVPTATALATASGARLEVTVPSGIGIYTGLQSINLTATHTRNSDLDLYLVSPDQTVFIISTDNGGMGADYSNITFSDAGNSTPPTTDSSFSGTIFKPEVQTFASYNGEMTGTWILYAIDDDSSNTGNLTNFSVTMNVIPSTTLNLYNMVINNSGTGLTINNNISIASSAVVTLTNGALLLNDHTLILNNTATTAIAGGSATAYIVSETNAAINNSIIQWKMGASTGAHIFPFGVNGSYIPFTFSKTTAGDADISVSTRATNSPDNLPLAGVSSVAAVTNMNSSSGGSAATSVIDRWWDISTSDTVTADLTFTYRGAENTMSVTPTGGITAQHWNGTTWDAPTGNGTGVTSGTGTVSVAGATTFSPWILTAMAAPLPISLLTFDAVCDQRNVAVNWSTITEINNDHFTVDKSMDGKKFTIVGTVKGSGNSIGLKNYSLTDFNPYKGTSYYRLTQTDYDGHSKIEKLIPVKNCFLNAIDVTVFNNMEGTITVCITAMQSENYSIIIRDILGKLIYAKNYKVAEGENTFQLTDVNLSMGAYFITVNDSNDRITKKIIVN